MKISIIIPNYNGLNYMKQFLHSVLDQDFDKKEIIIVDNDSDDGSTISIINLFGVIEKIR